MRSPGVGAQVTGMPTTIGAATTFTATTTFNKTLEAGAETVVEFKVSDDAVAKSGIYNATGAGFTFISDFRGTGSSTNIAQFISGRATMDSGSNPVLVFDGRQGSSTAITTRPLFDFRNAGTTVISGLPLNSGANLALSWGTQTGAAPAFTTRSAGTRIVLYNAISGTKVDNAIGVTANGAANTYSVQEATSSYKHSFYAGTTEVSSIRGDGYVTNAGPVGLKSYTVATVPTASSFSNSQIYVSNGAAGSPVVAFSDGTNWLRCDTLAAVSA